MTGDVDIVETAHAAAFFLADGVIVTGAATGRPADPAEVRALGEAVQVPVIVGSGISAENISAFADADAFIVGSWLKKDATGPSPSTRATRSARPCLHEAPRPVTVCRPRGRGQQSIISD